MKNILEKAKDVSLRFEALGTLNTIRIDDAQYDNKLTGRAVERVLEIDGRMSAFKPDSEISRLNRCAGSRSVPLSPETAGLLRQAKTFGELSGGAFDVTVRPLVELWGIGKKADFIPSEDEINGAARLVNGRDLVIDEKKHSAFLKHPGQAVDLGGIAKGYAADEVKRILAEGGVKSALINLGGNVVTMGAGPDKGPWKIGIQNPATVTGDYFGVLTVAGRTVSTSGCNERFFIRNGVRYHHILDPRTGKPARSGLLSVTVAAGGSAAADALSTALFVLGLEQGMQLLKTCGADAVFVTEGRKVFVTGGLLNSLSVLDAENS